MRAIKIRPRLRDGVNRGATLIGGKPAHFIGRTAGTIDSSSISSRVESDCWKVTGLHPPGFLKTPQKFCSFIGLTYYDKLRGVCKAVFIEPTRFFTEPPGMHHTLRFKKLS